jgi:hypothetical protein
MPERTLPRLLAFTVFAFACASSTVDLFELVGRPLRWLCLTALAILAIATVAARRSPVSEPSNTVLQAPGPRNGAGPTVSNTVLQSRWALLVPAGLFVGLGLVSAGWSIDARLSFGRAASLGVLAVAAGALAVLAAGDRGLARRLLLAILAGAVAVAAIGLAVLAIVYSDAVQPASEQYPARYRGMGQNPNTMPLLFAVALPLAAWWLWQARSLRDRVGAAGAILLLDGSIVASGSRGAMLAGFAATLLFVLVAAPTARVRALLGAAALTAVVASVGIAQIPNATTGKAPRVPPPGDRNAQDVLPLEGEIGRGPLDRPAPPIRRRLFGASGRARAWEGALDQSADRPALGYGFGTEEKVFVDRFYYFRSAVPENSYIGLVLQLGAAGLALFLALALALLLAAWSALRLAAGAERRMVAAAGAVLVSGLVLGLTQSYFVSVGNVAVGSVWICAAIAAGLGARRST